MQIIFQYFWAIMIVAMIAFAISWRAHSRPHIAADPELAEGYHKLIRGFLFWGNLPWVALGITSVCGGVSLFDFLDPQSRFEWSNPWIMSFVITVIVLWALLLMWVFLRGGAEALVRHPGWSGNISMDSPWKIKVMTLLMVAGGVAGLTLIILRPSA